MNETKLKSYQSGNEHLADELGKLDILLQILVFKRRQSGLPDRDDLELFRGLYITDEEIDRVTEEKEAQDPSAENRLDDLLSTLGAFDRMLSVKIESSIKSGMLIPLYQLASIFHLSKIELDILLICLAPEMDSKYEKLYAYLQDDVTKKSPSINFITELLCYLHQIPGMDRTGVRGYFMEQAPLFNFEVLKYVDPDSSGSKPMLSRCVKLDDRIVNFLVGISVIDASFSSFAFVVNPVKTPDQKGDEEWASLVLDQEVKKQFIRIADEWVTPSFLAGRNRKNTKLQRFVFYLTGPYGVGKKSAAAAFCSRLAIPLIVVHARDLLKFSHGSTFEFEHIIKRLFREAVLFPAAIYIEEFDRFLAVDAAGEGFYPEVIARAAEEFSYITFLSGEKPWNPRGRMKRQTFITIRLERPSFALRRRLWEKYLIPGEIESTTELDSIAGKFKLTAGEIKAAAVDARRLAALKHYEKAASITVEDLSTACRMQSHHKLRDLAQKIQPHYTWGDLVLPTDKIQQLKEIRNYVKYRHVVYSEWGFDRKLSLGKGLNILFSGPSGTGKTMSAEVIANELSLDLYKIDLSCIVSKYIGETEKNLSAIFREAETANSILFFDEADALFGKRSEVKDSHDRYANIEIGYLLQKMEEFEGVVILATNMKKNMDEAFVRRMHFTVDFPFPDELYRMLIWKSIFPGETPMEKEIDFDFLGRSFILSGGNIKNIALSAAFYAADDGKSVSMEHLIRACKREYQKMGKMCLKTDFGKYYDWVQDAEHRDNGDIP